MLPKVGPRDEAFLKNCGIPVAKPCVEGQVKGVLWAERPDVAGGAPAGGLWPDVCSGCGCDGAERVVLAWGHGVQW